MSHCTWFDWNQTEDKILKLTQPKALKNILWPLFLAAPDWHLGQTVTWPGPDNTTWVNLFFFKTFVLSATPHPPFLARPDWHLGKDLARPVMLGVQLRPGHTLKVLNPFKGFKNVVYLAFLARLALWPPVLGLGYNLDLAASQPAVHLLGHRPCTWSNCVFRKFPDTPIICFGHFVHISNGRSQRKHGIMWEKFPNRGGRGGLAQTHFLSVYLGKGSITPVTETFR